jgi:hypothetical protein
MHHLADGGHAQHGARELTAREVVAEMRLSDKRLGSGGGDRRYRNPCFPVQPHGSWWTESFSIALERRAAITSMRSSSCVPRSERNFLGGRDHGMKKVVTVQTTDGDITVRISTQERLTGKRIKRAIEEDAGHRSHYQVLFSGNEKALGDWNTVSEGDQVVMLISQPVWDRVYEAVNSLPGADTRSDISTISTAIADSFDTTQGELDTSANAVMELDTSQPFFYGKVVTYEDLEWRLDGFHSMHTHDEHELLATNIKVCIVVDVDWFDMEHAEEFVRALICAVSRSYTDPDIIEALGIGGWSLQHRGRDEYPEMFFRHRPRAGTTSSSRCRRCFRTKSHGVLT